MSYSYSPELAPPKRMPEIDPGKPAMAGMLKILVRTHQKQAEAFAPPPGLRFERITCPSAGGAEITCYLLAPEGAAKPMPGVLMIHGGAFYLPVQASALALTCEYAKGLNACIVLPEYRLVPDYPAPAALEDCLAAWRMMEDSAERLGLDPDRRLVMGDSAGAALAAGLCIRLREESRPMPKGQLLIYPVLDDRAGRYPSYAEYGEASWSANANRAMWRAYLKDVEEGLLSTLVPARCEDLKGLPPAYLEPQEFDVLRDEAVRFSEALKEAGVPVELNLVMGSYHGFDSDLTSPLVQRVLARRVHAAKEMLFGPHCV